MAYPFPPPCGTTLWPLHHSSRPAWKNSPSRRSVATERRSQLRRRTKRPQCRLTPTKPSEYTQSVMSTIGCRLGHRAQTRNPPDHLVQPRAYARSNRSTVGSRMSHETPASNASLKSITQMTVSSCFLLLEVYPERQQESSVKLF